MSSDRQFIIILNIMHDKYYNIIGYSVSGYAVRKKKLLTYLYDIYSYNKYVSELSHVGIFYTLYYIIISVLSEKRKINTNKNVIL